MAGVMPPAIVAYFERSAVDPQTGTPGVLRTEWRVRPVGAFTTEELEAAWGTDWHWHRPFVSYVLEKRYIRRGAQEPWAPFQSANSYDEVVQYVDDGAVAVDQALIRLQQKRAAAVDADRAKAAQARQAEAARADRQYHGDRARATFAKLAAIGDPAASAWEAWILAHRENPAVVKRVKNDPVLRPLYDAATTAETMPARRKAIKAFLAAAAAVVNPPVTRAAKAYGRLERRHEIEGMIKGKALQARHPERAAVPADRPLTDRDLTRHARLYRGQRYDGPLALVTDEQAFKFPTCADAARFIAKVTRGCAAAQAYGDNELVVIVKSQPAPRKRGLTVEEAVAAAEGAFGHLDGRRTVAPTPPARRELKARTVAGPVVGAGRGASVRWTCVGCGKAVTSPDQPRGGCPGCGGREWQPAVVTSDWGRPGTQAEAYKRIIMGDPLSNAEVHAAVVRELGVTGAGPASYAGWYRGWLRKHGHRPPEG